MIHIESVKAQITHCALYKTRYLTYAHTRSKLFVALFAKICQKLNTAIFHPRVTIGDFKKCFQKVKSHSLISIRLFSCLKAIDKYNLGVASWRLQFHTNLAKQKEDIFFEISGCTYITKT